jgi:hypothetical protein
MTINTYCKPYLKALLAQLEKDGTIDRHVAAHIAENGPSKAETYGVRLHRDGTVITVWSE